MKQDKVMKSMENVGKEMEQLAKKIGDYRFKTKNDDIKFDVKLKGGI